MTLLCLPSQLSKFSRLSFAKKGSFSLFISTVAGTSVELDISSLTKPAITSNSSSQSGRKLAAKPDPLRILVPR
jgi:hypothetical protein